MAHTSIWVREQLKGEFDNRVISKFSGSPWPSCIPDFSSLDYWVWTVCLAELQRSPSAILEELIATVEEYRDSLEEQEFRGVCRNILVRAQARIETGEAFGHTGLL